MNCSFERVLVWMLGSSLLLGLVSSGVASLQANQKCYAAGNCGGWPDSQCSGNNTI
jgi:hypothetical protein